MPSNAVRRNLAAMWDVQGVATYVNCSPRTIYRLHDAGKMPAAVRVGALVRWRRADIEAWVCEGCPPRRRITGA